jgi:putative hydrolase
LKIIIDTHTHTVSSGHAYSTVQEMARGAADNGIEIMAITDHGPNMLGAPSLYHFGNLKTIPDILYGVKIVRGVEVNIIDHNGNIDIPEEYLKKLEFAQASFHDICIEPSTREINTKTAIQVLSNPYIDALAHPGNPKYEVDIEEVVKAAKEYNKLIEINNHSFYVRTGSEENCLEFAKKCAQYGVRIVCGSDAHISFEVGIFDKVIKVLEKAGVPEELVLSSSVERFEAYLKERKERISHI